MRELEGDQSAFVIKGEKPAGKLHFFFSFILCEGERDDTDKLGGLPASSS